MKRIESGVAPKIGALMVGLSLVLGACGGGTPKPTVVNITSPAPNAQLDVGKSTVIKGVATGENIVRVDVLVNGKLYASASSGDATKGVGEMPVDGIAWTPATAGTHAIEFRVFGPNEQVLGRSDPVVITARGQVAAQPTAAPATATPALVPTAANPSSGGASGTAAPPANAGPSVTVSNDFVNVREGPNTAYRLLGRLEQGQTVPVRGKSADGTWWQISFAQGSGGVGWVFGELVTANAAASGVPVASAPPLPTQPPPPPPVVQPTAAPTTPPVVTGPRTAGNLNVDRDLVPPNGSVTVSWNVQGIQRADFDAGDGGGYKPAAGTMSFSVSGIASNRVLRLRITYNDGRVAEDSITIRVDATATGGAAPPPPSEQVCDASSPFWKERDNPEYKFCVRQDLEFVGDGLNLMSFGRGTDKVYRMRWDVFGIGGIRWRLFGESVLGCQTGGTSIDVPVPGTTDNHTFNIKDLPVGGYKIQLQVTRRDGGIVNYNEKVFCIR